MQALSGIFLSLSLVLAVVLGGQTIDYTWGPALVALALAMATGGVQAWRLGKQPRSAWFAFALILIASGWFLWRCWGSPVSEYGRSDALLVSGALLCCVWAWMMPARGTAVRLMMATLALLGVVNLGICLVQAGDPAFAWPFAGRPVLYPSGLFGHYNHLADFAQVSSLLLAARAIWGQDHIAERVFHALGVVASVVCVVMSHSRGGAVSLGAGIAVLFLCWGILAWRDKKRNRGVVTAIAVIVPLVIALLSPLIFSKLQERRGARDSSVAGAADDRFRLTMASFAIKISTTESVLTGSGSRSFGWKKNSASDPEQDKYWDRYNDDYVHNELLQAAVDYGWGGALLVVGAVMVTGLAGVAGLAGRDEADAATGSSLDALACGGLAAMAGTLLHSNFSFVTHTLPGAMYLGLAFGFALPKRDRRELPEMIGPVRFAPCLLVLPVAAVLAIAGWQGSMAYRTLWPALFGKEMLSVTAPGLAVADIQRAMQQWPGSELAGRAGHISTTVAALEELPASEKKEWLTNAADLYATAAKLNPYDPEWPVNRASALSLLGRNAEAEREFERAIERQGGAERNFRARYHFATHLYRRWYDAWTKERRAGEALGQFIRARDLLKESGNQGGFSRIEKDAKELTTGLDETIRFLEGAQVKPEPVKGD
ncbi:O-antigen ligase family protein [Luteolibacter flavescens]|uniref:O-antigen ligase family protein n=1 Tax=Luteolibacter flavescens TaxID=1859460 RepID=A0ABT3FNI8_9BACT|nr:O-antigen ligase family protein [Luteolibacter flavescens]MCW1885143.1 O-antigen ligase family protein [Luteolibacter flavescens]